MLYQIAHPLVSFFAKVFFRLQVSGLENVPKTGGVIISANHNSYFDIPLLGCALTRPADHIAKHELFENKLIGSFLRKMGGFPLRRGKADHQAIKEALSRLKRGRLLSYYPEGSRSKNGQLQKGKPGLGMIVVASGVNVVPAFIKGTHKIRPFRKVTICFGKPINFNGLIENSKKEEMLSKILYASISSKVMVEISRLGQQIDECPNQIHTKRS